MNISTETFNELDAATVSQLKNLTSDQQAIFEDMYEEQSKTTWVAYLLSLFYFHYAYQGKVGLTVLMWFLALISGGVISLVWWIVDLFRIPKMIRRKNSNIALDIIRKIK